MWFALGNRSKRNVKLMAKGQIVFLGIQEALQATNGIQKTQDSPEGIKWILGLPMMTLRSLTLMTNMLDNSMRRYCYD